MAGREYRSEIGVAVTETGVIGRAYTETLPKVPMLAEHRHADPIKTETDDGSNFYAKSVNAMVPLNRLSH